jgi:hypothetical protein
VPGCERRTVLPQFVVSCYSLDHYVLPLTAELQQELHMAIRKTVAEEPERLPRANLHPIARKIARAWVSEGVSFAPQDRKELVEAIFDLLEVVTVLGCSEGGRIVMALLESANSSPTHNSTTE